MAFEKFTNAGKSFKPKASIRANAQIGFNQGAIRRFRLKNRTPVLLYFDPVDRLVGVEVKNRSCEEPALFSLQVRNGSAWISAKAFLDYFEIDYSKTYRSMVELKDGKIVFGVTE